MSKAYMKNEPERQYHVDMVPGDVGEFVIIPGDPKRCAKIAKYFDDAKLVADHREYVTYTGYIEGEKVSVTSTGIGGPSASIAVEELTNLGAKVFVRVGTSGGMDLNVEGGDLVIATGAVRMEGTSKEYAPIEYPAVADYKVVDYLMDAAVKLGKTHHVGVVECKDSYYGQHEPEVKPVFYELQNKWEAWFRMGCLASEMESAAVYTVAQYRRVKAATILLVCGNQERRKRNMPDKIAEDTEDAIQVAVEAIRQMILDKKAGKFNI